MTALVERLRACPNPWCCAKSPPLLRALTHDDWRVMCACGVSSWRKPAEAEAIVAWNTRASDPLIEQLVEALAPFAAFADLSGAEYLPDDHVITMGSGMAARQLTMGDCRKARTALSAARGEDGK